MTFLEVENRIREIARLQSSNVPENILKEHINGLNDWKQQLIIDFKNTGNKDSVKKWIGKTFPEFDQNILR